MDMGPIGGNKPSIKLLRLNLNLNSDEEEKDASSIFDKLQLVRE
jgi:hypothetical protein